MCICFSELKGIVRSFHQKNRKKIRDCNLLGIKRHISIIEDEIVNNKAFEHASLNFTEPWALTIEIKLNIMQNFKFDFLENEF